jgi:ribosomal protein S18 acetylase RimI-like enzyme
VKAIELLAKRHSRSSFDCGADELNQFLQKTARQHIHKGLSRTWVLIEEESPSEIIGFFALTLCEVRIEKLPPQWAKKYPSVVPGVKLARLAVDKSWQRQGIGGILLVEAMRKALVVAENAGSIGLFVDAKNEAAQNYYLRYGFERLESSVLEMFLPLQTIQSLLKKENEAK